MPKELLVSDESYNSYNIRVMTSGGDFSRFENNPIMLFNHIRYSDKDGILPPGTWEGLRTDGDKLYATPVFDDAEDDFAMKLKGKYERGVIRSASLGINPVNVQEDTPDQHGRKRFTVTEWQLMEISVVDIPSNANAVAFYDENDQPIELNAVINMAANSTNKIELKMSKLNHVPALLGLTADASEQDVTDKINGLLKLKAENETLKAENEKLKEDAEAAQEQEIINLVSQAVDDKKIDKEDKDRYIKLMKADFDTTKELLEGMKQAKQIRLSDVPKAGPKAGADGGDVMKVEGMTFSEMQKKASDKLVQLKKEDFETFNDLYKSEFGKDYQV